MLLVFLLCVGWRPYYDDDDDGVHFGRTSSLGVCVVLIGDCQMTAMPKLLAAYMILEVEQNSERNLLHGGLT